MAGSSSSAGSLQKALTQIIQRASTATAEHTDPAVKRVKDSQDELENELQRLDHEMATVTSILETVTLDPETSARMQETQECLKRTKRKLTTIRGRLGKLRAYEESNRLHLAEQPLIAFGKSREHRVDAEDVASNASAERSSIINESSERELSSRQLRDADTDS